MKINIYNNKTGRSKAKTSKKTNKPKKAEKPKKEKYSVKEKRAYYLGQGVAVHKGKIKLPNLSEKEKESFNNGFNKMMGGK